MYRYHTPEQELHVEIPAFQLIGAVLVTGIIEAFKQAGLDSRWAAIASLATGVLVGVFWSAFIITDVSIAVGGVLGLIAGLTASGLYSGSKAVIEARPTLMDEEWS